MDDHVAESIRIVVDEMINRESGNIILVVGSSECGKSTLLSQILLPIFSKTNGWITSFISHNFDSLPLQSLIMSNLSDKQTEAAKGEFNPDMIYKVKEWIFMKRGYDAKYPRYIHHLKLLINRRYNTPGAEEKRKEFRFCLALDDEIDIGGRLIREVCMTWRNQNISWIQLVQDITCLDCAVRNSAPLVLFGYLNFPARREQVVKGYLAPYLPGANWKEKMVTYAQLTSNKRFIFMNHRERRCYHLDTRTGVVTEMPELVSEEDLAQGFANIEHALAADPSQISAGCPTAVPVGSSNPTQKGSGVSKRQLPDKQQGEKGRKKRKTNTNA